MSSSTPAEVRTLGHVPVADLRPYRRNPRRGDVAQSKAQLLHADPPYGMGTPLRNGTPLLLEG